MQETTTRENVFKHLPKACERLGIPAPKFETFRRSWTSKGGRTHYRCDPKRGNELHAIDTSKGEADGPQFLKTEDEA